MRWLFALLMAVCAASARADNVPVPVAPGLDVYVEVTYGCYGDWRGGYADLRSGVAYLCGREDRRDHELAHFAGMEHGPWVTNAHGVTCARVSATGYATAYRVGDVICVGPLGRGEWVER